MPNQRSHPLVRSAVVLVLVALGLGLTLATEPDQQIDDRASEPYPPFRMTYTSRFDSGATIELTWLGINSWATEVVATVERQGGAGRRVGDHVRYDGATYTAFSPLTGIRTRYMSCQDHGLIPGPWFVPYRFVAEEGFEALGRGADGYDQFLRVIADGEIEYRRLVKRDPASGLVMEVLDWDGSAYVTEFQVLSLELLPESYASPGACDTVEILHLQPPPEAQPTRAVE